MAKELQDSKLRVDYLFSGRDPQALFNMEPFGDYRCCRGLTFVTRKGKLRYLDTLLHNNLLCFVREVRSLDLSAYDLVLTDFEPISAWAARLQKIPSIAVGHQYAFMHDIPTQGDNLLTSIIMRVFAPAELCIGIHWHHFNATILPPLIEPPDKEISVDPGKILVYLPFDDTEEVTQWLKKFTDYTFHIYCEQHHEKNLGHLRLHSYSRNNFQTDLASCDGVISNAGFGLSSEAMQYGKKILVKPLQHQMEQLSNAQALLQLNLGDVIYQFDDEKLIRWLAKPNPPPIVYPNVARALVHWLEEGHAQNPLQLTQYLWRQVAQANTHLAC